MFRRQRHLATGGRVWEAKPRNLLSCPFLPGCLAKFGSSAQHLLGGHSLSGFSPHLGALSFQYLCLSQCILAFFTAAALIVRPRLQVGVPAHPVDLNLRAVSIQVKHLIDDVSNQTDVVTDDNKCTRVCFQPVPQPDDGVVIQVVGWLI